MRGSLSLLLGCVAAACSGAFPIARGESAAPPRVAVSQVSVEGTSFKVVTADGTVLRSPDLVGAVLGIRQEGQIVRLRIDLVERDTMDRSGRVWLHKFSFQRPDGTWAPFCEPGPDGKDRGFPLAGRANHDDGMLQAAPDGVFDVACTSGARGKCVRIGYHPWTTTPDGQPVLPLYNACIRMVRADYSGRSIATTRDGTTIDIYDRFDVVASEPDPNFTFEAGWNEDGAVCVHHPRMSEHITLALIEAQAPRLKERTGTICTREYAIQHGALIFNGSKP